MKKMLFTLVTMLTIAASANAMSYEQARNEALFLTDKMAYELNLSDAQYEAAYEINLDYLMGVTSYDDVFGVYWERRNLDLSYILYQWQWDAFRAATYFYRPLYWDGGYWHFGIYARYPHRDYLYFGRPHFFASYHGGHSWRYNAGRSYYEGRHDHFRPHVSRDHHVGMRNSWDRGDYRHGNGRSSTHITDRTGRHSDNNRNFGHDNGTHRNNGNFGNDNGTHHNNGNFGNDNGTHHNNGSSGSFGGNRNSNSTYGSQRGSAGSSSPRGITSGSSSSSSQGRFSTHSSSSSPRSFSSGSSSSSSHRGFSGSSSSSSPRGISAGSSSSSSRGSFSSGSSSSSSRGSFSGGRSGSGTTRGSSSGSAGGHSRSGGGRR